MQTQLDLKKSRIIASDEVLIARVARRDPQALEALYERYSSAAMGVAMKILGDRNSAEEIVQEAFWRVWERARTFDDRRGQLGSWVLSIVSHLAIDELRRRRARPPSTSGDSEDQTVIEIRDASPDVAETVWRQVEGSHLRHAVTQLPEPQRKVIELAYFQGLTHREIAEKTGQPIGTVHTRAQTALRDLRHLLMPLHLNEA